MKKNKTITINFIHVITIIGLLLKFTGLITLPIFLLVLPLLLFYLFRLFEIDIGIYLELVFVEEIDKKEEKENG